MYLKTPQNAIGCIEHIDIVSKDYEQVVVITMDNNGKYINDHILGVGDRYSVGFNFRDLLKIILNDDSMNFILIHNHPSGVTEPSNEDLLVTKQIQLTCSLANINLLDHIIVGNNYADVYSSYFSFSEKGLIEEQSVTSLLTKLMLSDYTTGGKMTLEDINYDKLGTKAISGKIIEELNERITILNNEYSVYEVELALSLYRSDEIENVFWEDYSQEFFDEIRSVVEMDIAYNELKSSNPPLINSKLIIKKFGEHLEEKIRDELDLSSISKLGYEINKEDLDLNALIYFKEYQEEIVATITKDIINHDYISDYNNLNDSFRLNNTFDYTLEEHLEEVLISNYLPDEVNFKFSEDSFYKFVHDVKPTPSIDIFAFSDSQKSEFKNMLDENIDKNIKNIELIKANIKEFTGNELFDEKEKLFNLGAISFNQVYKDDYRNNATEISLLNDGPNLNSLYDNLQIIKKELKMQMILNMQIKSPSELDFTHLEAIKNLISNDHSNDSTMGNNETSLYVLSEAVYNGDITYEEYKNIYDQIENDYSGFFDISVYGNLEHEISIISNEELETIYKEQYRYNDSCLASDVDFLKKVYSNYYSGKFETFDHVNTNINNQNVEVTIYFNINNVLQGVCFTSSLDEWKNETSLFKEFREIYETLPELKSKNSIQKDNYLEI